MNDKQWIASGRRSGKTATMQERIKAMTQTKDLIDAARLLCDANGKAWHNETRCTHDAIAEAQLAKFGYAMVDWLESQPVRVEQSDPAYLVLRDCLKQLASMLLFRLKAHNIKQP